MLPALVSVQAADQPNPNNPPESWIDPDTGHRVVRLTQQPGSASLYFNQNGYTGNGKEMVFTTAQGISVLDLATHAARPVVEGKVRVIVAGRKSQRVYYTKDGSVYSTDVDTRETRKIAQLLRAVRSIP